MDLSDHNLSQLDEEALLKLPEEALRKLSVRLLKDLKEARERLKQNSRNSSRPPGSEAPWEKISKESDSNRNRDESNDPPTREDLNQDPARRSKPGPSEPAKKAERKEGGEPRKPGKQPGAQGFGREQEIAITAVENHIPDCCSCCNQPLNGEIGRKAYTAFETVDIEWSDRTNPGIRLINTQHTYYETTCQCGHTTRKEPHRTPPHELLPDIQVCQWRLVGPGLAALIVCLTYRMRLSRQRTREFLQDWLGLDLSVGTINNTVHESGAAAMPVEDELVKEVVDSQLLHVDETSWMELNTLLWLWVFSTDTVVAYWIAFRSSELIENLLGEAYGGWLMSDGYSVYRKYLNRVRCWAHLLRKAQGLEESLNQPAKRFGRQTLALMNLLMEAVRAAREHPPDRTLPETYQVLLFDYRQTCEQMKSSSHEKARAFATEMLNDWEAIFTILHHPHLPLTNNEAERALRHWVILRRICYGTRTVDGSRVFAILISVIETCRKRQQSPWLYLAAVIQNRRAGLPVPALPVCRGV